MRQFWLDRRKIFTKRLWKVVQDFQPKYRTGKCVYHLQFRRHLGIMIRSNSISFGILFFFFVKLLNSRMLTNLLITHIYIYYLFEEDDNLLLVSFRFIKWWRTPNHVDWCVHCQGTTSKHQPRRGQGYHGKKSHKTPMTCARQMASRRHFGRQIIS